MVEKLSHMEGKVAQPKPELSDKTEQKMKQNKKVLDILQLDCTVKNQDKYGKSKEEVKHNTMMFPAVGSRCFVLDGWF